MSKRRGICFAALLLSLSMATLALVNPERLQQTSRQWPEKVNHQTATHDDDPDLRKEKFHLCLGMLKEYYSLLDSRVEKSFALLIVVIGWITTSETARKTISEEKVWFWAALATLTAAILFLCINISHLLHRFRDIQATVEQLNYVEISYFSRYRMPDYILLVYLAPIMILYVFIALLLMHLRFKIFSISSRREA